MPDAEPELKQLQVPIPEELHKRCKVVAAERGESMREVVIHALEAWLSRRGK
jgi:predicted HicB family RNase H-like nuclease